MSNDLSESVSQGSYGAYDEENRRIQEVSDELRRRTMKKIEESKKSPMNSVDAANYMKRNFEMAKTM